MARKGRTLKLSGLSLYGGIFVLVISFLAVSSQGNGVSPDPGIVAASQSSTSLPGQPSGSKISVDQLAAADAVANLAEVTSLPVAGDLREETTTLHIKKQLAQNDVEVITKPQIIQPETSAKRGIASYVTKAGENLGAIAKQFGVSAQTLRWANGMTSDAVEPGKTLLVPKVDGVLYTVKDGDTIESIAAKYKVDGERVVLYNDLEVGAPLAKDTKLVLPHADLPETERPGYVAPRPYRRSSGSYGWSYGSMSGSVTNKSYGFPGPSAGNRYAAGNCTWYAYERRIQLGRPIGGMWGNAYSWAIGARSSGFLVDKNPAPGAVIQTSSGGGGYGHVGVVERIEGGNMIISDMNYAGWNVVTWRVIPLSQAGSYWFIH